MYTRSTNNRENRELPNNYGGIAFNPASETPAEEKEQPALTDEVKTMNDNTYETSQPIQSREQKQQSNSGLLSGLLNSKLKIGAIQSSDLLILLLALLLLGEENHDDELAIILFLLLIVT